MLLKRGNYLKLSLFALFSGVLSFILSSFLIFLAYLLNAVEIYPVTIAIFFIDLLLIIVGVVYAIREVAVSVLCSNSRNQERTILENSLPQRFHLCFTNRL